MNTNIYHWNTDPDKGKQNQIPSSGRYFCQLTCIKWKKMLEIKGRRGGECDDTIFLNIKSEYVKDLSLSKVMTMCRSKVRKHIQYIKGD